jgi:Dolichyl-phosphate-mannose-protein mannosyltransferase
MLLFALIAASALALALALGIRSVPALALAAYVLGAGLIILAIEFLSAFGAVTYRNVLEAELALASASAALLWVRRSELGVTFPRSLRQVLRERPVVGALLAVVVCALGYELALALFTPPNNWDSMTYHLSRAAAWYQHHRVSYVTSHSERENANPPNAEILVLFTFLFGRGDRFAAMWQWLAGPASMIAIFMVARRLPGPRTADALFAALLFACLSQVALQSVTTQNDLLVASFVIAALAFFSSSVPGNLPLGGLSLGLAVGTKFTAAFAIVPVIVLALLVVPRPRWKQLALVTVGGVAAFGVFGYALNLVKAGSLLGAASATRGLHQHTVGGFAKTIGGVLLQLVVDVRGMPHLPANEDTSYFGLLGVVLFVPVIVLTLRRSMRGAAVRLETGLALAAPTYLVCLAVANAYNMFLGRFMITAAALTAPLFAQIPRWPRYAAVVTAVATLSVLGALLFDQAKPSGLAGTGSIWEMNRSDAQALQRPAMRGVLETIAAEVPLTARIGYLLDDDDWDYPLYGPHFTRHLVGLPGRDAYRAATRDGLRWILVRRRRAGAPQPGWEAHRFPAIGLILLERAPSVPAD